MATLTRNESGGVIVLRLDGPLTHDGVPLVREAFDAATAGPARVVLDLGGVSLITTPGLSLLLNASRRLQDLGGRLVLTGVTPMVDDVFRRCRFDAVLTVLPDRDAALRRAAE